MIGAVAGHLLTGHAEHRAARARSKISCCTAGAPPTSPAAPATGSCSSPSPGWTGNATPDLAGLATSLAREPLAAW